VLIARSDLLLLAAVAVATLFAPAPRAALPSALCLVPVLAGAALLLAAIVLWPLAGLAAAAQMGTWASTAMMLAFWIARAPFPEPPDEDPGGGGGGGGGDRPWTPPGGGIDWEAFDLARALWGHCEQHIPPHARHPVTVEAVVSRGAPAISEGQDCR
jgi:hypothetical protein